MKVKPILATTMMAVLSLTVAAQQKPPVSIQLATGSDATAAAQTSAPPALCNPCLFYGGDITPNGENAEGMADENTLSTPDTSSYAAFEVPDGVTATITGILFNVQASANFDPRTASYEIRTGVSEGYGGTVLISGTRETEVEPTGRSFSGLKEYTVFIRLSDPEALNTGEYWFNLTPNCTNGAVDGSCYSGGMYFSNTTKETNAMHPERQPASS
ncbi:MAG: hypothetical protein WCC95_06550, partial [Candidatus Sulfotelmatobacter sp.]